MHIIVTIVFLALAYINYVQPSPLCTVPGPYGFLSSMWLMYLVMGAAHFCLWLTLINKTHASACCCSNPSEPTNK